MAGPLPLAASEILAFCQLYGRRLEPWELTAVRMLDAAFLQHMLAKLPK